MTKCKKQRYFLSIIIIRHSVLRVSVASAAMRAGAAMSASQSARHIRERRASILLERRRVDRGIVSAVARSTERASVCTSLLEATSAATLCVISRVCMLSTVAIHRPNNLLNAKRKAKRPTNEFSRSSPIHPPTGLM